jgi:hypothetical protein
MPTPQPILATSDAAAALAPAEAVGVVRLHEVDCLIRSLVASWQGSGPLLERRRWHRVRFERPLGITALDEEDGQPTGAMCLVRGKDVSVAGISFTHTEPIPQRIVAVTFWDEQGATESVVTQLTWCRFTRAGVYQSGGQFLKKVNLVAQMAADDTPLLQT